MACYVTGDDFITMVDSSVREAGENRKETCMQIGVLTHLKKTARVGGWNVHTMYSNRKSTQVCRERDGKV